MTEGQLPGGRLERAFWIGVGAEGLGRESSVRTLQPLLDGRGDAPSVIVGLGHALVRAIEVRRERLPGAGKGIGEGEAQVAMGGVDGGHGGKISKHAIA